MRVNLVALFLSLCISSQAQTNFNHPISGFQTFTLGPGVYNYYDNGGPNGDYANNIDGSIIRFIPQTGHRIAYTYLSFDVEDFPPFDCWDYLDVTEFGDCGFLFPTFQYCNFPDPASKLLCNSESLEFAFYSDGSITKSGWHIRMVVEPTSCIRRAHSHPIA